MVRVVRRVGIAIGSLAIAFLALALIGGIAGFLGLPQLDRGVFGLAVVVLGGLIFADIIRRERPAAAPTSSDAP